MTIFAQASHFESTASNRFAADTLPADLSELGDHLDSCQNTHRYLMTVRCAALATRNFIRARLVTTAMVVAGVLGLAVWLL